MAKFAIKRVTKPIKKVNVYKPLMGVSTPKVDVIDEKEKVQEVITEEGVKTEQKINKNKKTNDMETKDKIAYASAILANEPVDKVKKIKKEKGLIERTESSKIILTEDNKELLND